MKFFGQTLGTKLYFLSNLRTISWKFEMNNGENKISQRNCYRAEQRVFATHSEIISCLAASRRKRIFYFSSDLRSEGGKIILKVWPFISSNPRLNTVENNKMASDSLSEPLYQQYISLQLH